MFNNPIVLTKLLKQVKDVTLYNRSFDVEMNGFKFTVRIEPVINSNKYIFLIYINTSDKSRRIYLDKLVAYSTKKYYYIPSIIEADAFKCIQSMVNELDSI